MDRDATPSTEREYDVCLSFASEQQSYVEKVAHHLRSYGIRVFYSDYEKAALWGKDLHEHLDWVYQHSAQYCVLFASADYAAKVWTSHERKSAQARALVENSDYVLPVRFDDTEIPGLRPTIQYVDARNTTEIELVDLICDKLGRPLKKNHFPHNPIALFDALQVVDDAERAYVEAVGRSFMREMTRTALDERRLIGHIFLMGCHSHLPDNVHISLDIVRRDLSISPNQVLETLRRLDSLGFEFKLRESMEDHAERDIVEVSWLNPMSYNDKAMMEYSLEYATLVAARIIEFGAGNSDGCLQCFYVNMVQLDFSNLALPISDVDN
ncbi:toll/interleukin-1 receptor domain-containing protein [Microtetraspora malaysiensis]|uniref:toll/interleukin-1 receptor domain-containing protein n=1 Tax=Microtetraspora malaysiensis TaxID=161358 RepID=UPI003D931486